MASQPPAAVGSPSLPPVGGWIPWDELEHELEHDPEHDGQLEHEHDKGTRAALSVEVPDRRSDGLSLSPSVVVLPRVPNPQHKSPDAMRSPLPDGTVRNRDGGQPVRVQPKSTVFVSPPKGKEQAAMVVEGTVAPVQTAASQTRHKSPLRWSPSPELLSHLRARDAAAPPGTPNRRRTSFSVSPAPTSDARHQSSLGPKPKPEPEPPPAARSGSRAR